MMIRNEFSDYDAGLIGDHGGGDVGWWQDYIRSEIERANEHWRAQIEQRPAVPQGWQPMETAPKDGSEILCWNEHSGMFIASYTSADSFPLSQSEIDEADEESLFQKDWFTQWPQALRLEGSELPTKWMPLPALLSAQPAPQPADPSVCRSCNGHGVIGWTTGQTPESFDQGEAPCPECGPQPAEQSSAHWSASNPGLADQYRAEAMTARIALGFAESAENVSPADIRGAIATLKQRADSAVPEGWRIKRTDDGRIIVRKRGVVGYVAGENGESIAESALYYLADALLSAQPAEQQPDVTQLLKALERIANMDSMSYHSLDSAKITARSALAAYRKSCCGDPGDCQEPCGDMGKSEAHVRVSDFSLGDPERIRAGVDELSKRSRAGAAQMADMVVGDRHPAPAVQGEPVAWQCVWPGGGEFTTSSYESAKNYRDGAVSAHGEGQAPCIRPLYTAPQPAPDVAGLVEALSALRGCIMETRGPDAHSALVLADAALAAHRKQGGEA